MLSRLKRATQKSRASITAVDINSHVTHLIELEDGRLASGSQDGILRIWNVCDDSMTCSATFFSPDQSNRAFSILNLEVLSCNTLVVSYGNNCVEFWSTSGKIPICFYQFDPTTLDSTSGLGDLVSIKSLSSDYLVCAFSSGAVRAWHLNQLNLNLLASNSFLNGEKINLTTLMLANSFAICAQSEEMELPATLLSTYRDTLVSLHYSSTPANRLAGTIASSGARMLEITKGHMKIWQLDSETNSLQLQDTINYPVRDGKTLALALLPNNLIVTAKTNSESTIMQISQLVNSFTGGKGLKTTTEIDAKNRKPDRYALLPLTSTSITDGVRHLLPSPRLNKFISVTPNGLIQIWEIGETEITINPVESFDLAEPIRCAPILLSNGCLISNNGIELNSQRTILCERAALTSRFRFNEGAEVPKSFPKVDFDKLKEVTSLGEGAFGTAYKAKYQNGIPLALKQAFTSQGIAMLLDEIKLHIQLSNENIIGMHGFARNSSNEIFLAMELMTCGDLFDLLRENKGNLPLRTRLAIGLDIGNALLYLHTLFIIHRDIKPENVFIKKKPNGEYLAKLADFGLAQKWDKSTPGIEGFTGTYEYLAPEVWVAPHISNVKTDIFAYSILLWDLVTDAADYLNACGISSRNRDELQNVIPQGKRAALPSGENSILNNLITRLWHQRGEIRPDISEAIETISQCIRSR